ncbi:hypothetical protein FJY93_03715, partial [Candidatus Kaiserbacteria bacterium]|nr:hypothetical protein [Candidatus Kaiserbacteria bacterium]
YGCSTKSNEIAQMVAGAAYAETRINPALVHTYKDKKGVIHLSQHQGLPQTPIFRAMNGIGTISALTKNPAVPDHMRAEAQRIVDKFNAIMQDFQPGVPGKDPRMDPEVGAWILTAYHFNNPDFNGFASALAALDLSHGNIRWGAAYVMSAQLLPAIHLNPNAVIGPLENGKAVSLLRANNVSANGNFKARDVVNALSNSPNYKARFTVGINAMRTTQGLPSIIQGFLEDTSSFIRTIISGAFSAQPATNYRSYFPDINKQINKTFAARVSTAPTTLTALPGATSFSQLAPGASVTPYLKPFDFSSRLSLTPTDPFIVANISPVVRSPHDGRVLSQPISPDLLAALDAGQEDARAEAIANTPLPPTRPTGFASDAPLPPVRPTAALEALAQAEARAAADALAQAQKVTNEDLAKAQAEAAEKARIQIAAEDALARAQQINEGLAQAQDQAAQAAREKIAAEDALALIKKITNANLARIQEQVAQAQRETIAAEDAQATRDVAAVRDQAASAEYDRLAALAQAQQKHLVDAQAKAVQDAADEKAAAQAKVEAQRLADVERDLKIAEAEKAAAKAKSDAAIAEYERLAAEFQARSRVPAQTYTYANQVPYPYVLSYPAARPAPAVLADITNPFAGKDIASLSGAPASFLPQLTQPAAPLNNPLAGKKLATYGGQVSPTPQPDFVPTLVRATANVPTPPQRPSNIGSVAAPKAVVDINRILRRGSVGEGVSHWQEFLIARGYGKDDSGTDMPLDGIYGPRTEQATRDFQRAVGVRVDGVFGPETRSVLREESPAASQAVPTPSGETVSPDLPAVPITPTPSSRTPFQKFLNWLTTPSQWLNPVSPAPAAEVQNPRSSLGDLFKPSAETLEAEAQKTAAVQETAKILSQEAQKIGLPIGEISKVADVSLFVPSSRGQYIVEIRLQHKAPLTDQVTVGDVSSTADVQKDALTIIKNIAASRPSTQFFMEGAGDNFASEMASSKQQYDQFRKIADVEIAATKGQPDVRKIMATFANYHKATVGGALTPTLTETYAASLLNDLNARNISLPQDAQTYLNGLISTPYNNLSDVALYRKGALEVAYLQGDIQSVAGAENESLVNALSLANKSAQRSYIDNVNQDRESYMAQSIVKQLTASNASFVVFPVGGTHDLSQEIKAADDGVGYIVLTPHSYPKESLNVFGQRSELTPIPVTSAETAPASPATTETPRTPMQKFLNWLTTPSQWLNPVSPAPAAEVPVPPRRPVGLEVEVSSPAPTLTDPFAGKRLVLYGGQVSPTPQPDFLPTLEQAGYLQDQLLQMYGFTPALLPKNISQQVAASILPPAPSAYPIALPPQTNPMMQIPTIILSDKEIDLIVQEATDKLNAYWTDVFAQHDLSYGPVKVVLYGGHFDTSTHSDATSYDSGSYFNHPDQTIYMDRSSLRMQSLFWANANGVTIMESVAHEMGHYVANLTGAYTAALSRTSYDPNFHHFYLPGDTVQLGQRKELQADYLAGVSMRGAGLLSQGDPQNIFYEAVTSGDDYGKILVGTKPNADELKNDNDPHGTSAERAQTIYAGLLPTGSVEIGLAMLGTPLPWVEPNTLGSQGPALPFELAPALATAGRYQADVSVSAGAEKSAFTSGDAGKALKTSMDGVTKVDLLAGKVKDIALYGLSANDSNMLYTAADTLSVEAKGISKNIIMAAESANGKMTPALRSALENGSVATRLSASSEKLLNQAKDMIARQNALMKAQTPVPTSVIEGVSPAIPQTPGLSGQSIQEGASIPSGFTTPQPGASSPPISVPAQTAPPINPNRTFLEKVWDAITHPSQLSFTQSAPAAEVGAPASTAAVPDTVFGKLMADAVREQFALQNAEYAAQQANRSAGQKILNALSMSKSWAGPSIAEVERISVEAAALEYAKEADMACAAFGFNPVGTCTVAMTGVFALETSNFSVGENSTAQGTDNANSGGLAQLTWDTAPLVWNVLEHNAAFRQRFMDGPNGYIHNFRDFWNAIQGFDWRINGPWVFAAHATLNNSGRDLNDQSTLERVLHRYNASPTYPAVVRNNMTILLGYGQPGQFPTTQSGRPQSTPLMQAMMGVMNKYPLAGIASTRVAANNPMAYAQANANAQMANAFLRPDSGWATEDTTVYTGPVQPDAAVVDATPKPDPTLEPRKETLQQSLAALQASGKAALDAGAVADRNKAAEPVEALKYAAQALRAGEKALQDAAKVAVAAGDTTGIKQSIDGLISEVESTARRIDAGVADPGFLNANLLPFKDTLEPQIRDFESRGQALTAQAQKVANAELARITESQSAVQHVVVVPTEKLSFTEYAGVPSPHQPSQPAPQINPTVKSRIVGNIPAQAHPRILIPAQYASATLPPGYTVILTPHGVYRANPSIYDSMHGPLHTEVVDGQMRASAIDFQIIDPQGQPLQNIQSPQNFQIYWEFAKNWKAFHDALYPTRTDEGRWGGFFSDVANDMMHIDLKSRTQHPTAAGSWEHGLSAEYQKFAAPGQNTSGMGPIASYQIIDRSGTGLTLASAKAGLGTQVAGAPQVVQASRSAVQRVVTDFNFNTTNAIAYVANFFAGRLGFGEHPEITGTPAQTQTQESGVEPQTQEPQEEAATQPDEVWMSTGITFWDAAETAFWTWVAWRTGILSYVSSFLNRRPNVTAQPVARQQTAGDNAPPPEPPTGVRVPGNEILSAANDSESPQEIQKGFPAALEGPRAPAPQGGFPAALEGPRGVPAPVPLTRGTLSLRTLADLAKKYPVETVVGGGVVVGGGLMLAGIEEGSIAGGAGPGAVAGGTGAVVGGGAGAGASPAGAKPAAASTLGPSDRPPFFAVLNQFPTITQKTITEQPPAPDKTVPPPRAPTRIPRVTPGGRPSYPGVPSYPGYPDGFGYHGYGNGYGYGPQSLMQAFRMSQMRKQQEQQRQRAQQQALLAQLARQMQQQRQQQQAAAQQKDTTLPTLQFTASPATVARNASTTLSWTSTNTNDCYIFDAAGKYLTGGKSSGSYPIGAVFETTSYGMTCTSYGYGQNVYATTTVRVATSTSGR